MALPDPSGSPPADKDGPAEKRRRVALFKTFFSAYLIAGVIGVPGWLDEPHRSLVGFCATVVPAAVSSLLLIALAMSIRALFPEPRLTPILAITSSMMHVTVMTACATVLTIRPDALLSLPPEMENLARWTNFPLECIAFFGEVGILFAYAGLKAFVRRARPPEGE